MFDLKIIIEKYPQNIGNRNQLASLLRDLYPSEKRAVNVALAVYDSGIASRIAGSKSLDTVLLHSFTKQLVDEYGLQEQFAAEGIAAWAKAYGLPVGKDNTDTSHGIPQNNITHDPDAYAQPGMVNGSASDYELEQTSEGYIISKFKGFDEPDMVIPNTIDGKKIVGIGKGAYLGCIGLQTLVISDGIEFIEDGAFSKCKNLSKVTFPVTLIRIGSIEHSVHPGKIPNGVFQGCGLTEVVLPEGLKKLGESTFNECLNLKSIDMPNGITEIEYHTFADCRSLKQIILPEHLLKIGNCAFYGCSMLNDIRFPLSLQTIGEYAFSKCTSLNVVVLNEGLDVIGKSAFGGCKNLTKILIPSTVSEIEDDELYDLFDFYKSTEPKPTIYCYAGSYGLEFARKKGYPIQNAANFTN
jgi:hypothetical protein